MSQLKTLQIETRGQIDIVTMNRPEVLNVVNPLMADELRNYFASMVERFDKRVIVLRGSGRGFCAGGDVGSEAFASPGSGRAQRQMQVQLNYSGIVRMMRKCPQPIIGLIQGYAFGAGFSLALACDVRYAGPNAKFNAAYIRMGLGGCDMARAGYLLPRLVGLSVASEFLLTGRFIDAQRAKSIELVSDIVSDDKLLDTGLELVDDMMRGSPMGLRMTKESLSLEIDAPSLAAALTLEDRQQTMLMEMADFREAVAAFKDNERAPRYEDR